MGSSAAAASIRSVGSAGGTSTVTVGDGSGGARFANRVAVSILGIVHEVPSPGGHLVANFVRREPVNERIGQRIAELGHFRASPEIPEGARDAKRQLRARRPV